jgi:hypothetical protein
MWRHILWQMFSAVSEEHTFSIISVSSVLMIEAADSPKKSVNIVQVTWRHIPITVTVCHHKKLKSHVWNYLRIRTSSFQANTPFLHLTLWRHRVVWFVTFFSRRVFAGEEISLMACVNKWKFYSWDDKDPSVAVELLTFLFPIWKAL